MSDNSDDSSPPSDWSQNSNQHSEKQYQRGEGRRAIHPNQTYSEPSNRQYTSNHPNTSFNQHNTVPQSQLNATFSHGNRQPQGYYNHDFFNPRVFGTSANMGANPQPIIPQFDPTRMPPPIQQQAIQMPQATHQFVPAAPISFPGVKSKFYPPQIHPVSGAVIMNPVIVHNPDLQNMVPQAMAQGPPPLQNPVPMQQGNVYPPMNYYPGYQTMIPQAMGPVPPQVQATFAPQQQVPSYPIPPQYALPTQASIASSSSQPTSSAKSFPYGMLDAPVFEPRKENTEELEYFRKRCEVLEKEKAALQEQISLNTTQSSGNSQKNTPVDATTIGEISAPIERSSEGEVSKAVQDSDATSTTPGTSLPDTLYPSCDMAKNALNERFSKIQSGETSNVSGHATSEATAANLHNTSDIQHPANIESLPEYKYLKDGDDIIAEMNEKYGEKDGDFQVSQEDMIELIRVRTEMERKKENMEKELERIRQLEFQFASNQNNGSTGDRLQDDMIPHQVSTELAGSLPQENFIPPLMSLVVKPPGMQGHQGVPVQQLPGNTGGRLQEGSSPLSPTVVTDLEQSASNIADPTATESEEIDPSSRPLGEHQEEPLKDELRTDVSSGTPLPDDSLPQPSEPIAEAPSSSISLSNDAEFPYLEDTLKESEPFIEPKKKKTAKPTFAPVTPYRPLKPQSAKKVVNEVKSKQDAGTTPHQNSSGGRLEQGLVLQQVSTQGISSLTPTARTELDRSTSNIADPSLQSAGGSIPSILHTDAGRAAMIAVKSVTEELAVLDITSNQESSAPLPSSPTTTNDSLFLDDSADVADTSTASTVSKRKRKPKKKSKKVKVEEVEVLIAEVPDTGFVEITSNSNIQGKILSYIEAMNQLRPLLLAFRRRFTFGSPIQTEIMEFIYDNCMSVNDNFTYPVISNKLYERLQYYQKSANPENRRVAELFGHLMMAISESKVLFMDMIFLFGKNVRKTYQEEREVMYFKMIDTFPSWYKPLEKPMAIYVEDLHPIAGEVPIHVQKNFAHYINYQCICRSDPSADLSKMREVELMLHQEFKKQKLEYIGWNGKKTREFIRGRLEKISASKSRSTEQFDDLYKMVLQIRSIIIDFDIFYYASKFEAGEIKDEEIEVNLFHLWFGYTPMH